MAEIKTKKKRFIIMKEEVIQWTFKDRKEPAAWKVLEQWIESEQLRCYLMDNWISLPCSPSQGN